MRIKKVYQVQAQGWSWVHSDLKRLKDIFPLLYFIFHLPFTLYVDTQGEFLLSSPAKAMTTGEEQMGDITGVKSEKWSNGRRQGF